MLRILALSLLALGGCATTCDDVQAAADACEEKSGASNTTGLLTCADFFDEDILNCMEDAFLDASCTNSSSYFAAQNTANVCMLGRF